MARRSAFRSEQGRLAIQAFTRQVLARAPLPLRRHEIETTHGPTHVFDAGPEDAPPLILLHGTSTNAASWFGDLPVWSRHYRVFAPDMPGEPGLSADWRLPLRTDDVERWLASLLDGLGVPRAPLIGMSLGGFAALRFATRQPERVRALCLIAPSGLAPQRLSFLFKALPLLLLGDWGVARVNRLVFHGVPVPEEMLAFGRLVAKQFRPVGVVPLLSDAELGRLRMPVQYLAGAHDALLPTQASAERLRRSVPQAEIIIRQERGHLVVGEQETILAFLRRHLS